MYDFDVEWFDGAEPMANFAAPEAMADFAFEEMAVPMGPEPRIGLKIMEKGIEE